MDYYDLKISEILIRNGYKGPFSKIDILKPILSFAGPNGVGKTTLLENLERAFNGNRASIQGILDLAFLVKVPLNYFNEDYFEGSFASDPLACTISSAVRNFSLASNDDAAFSGEVYTSHEIFFSDLKSAWSESITDAMKKIHRWNWDNDKSLSQQENDLARYKNWYEYEEYFRADVEKLENDALAYAEFMIQPSGRAGNPSWDVFSIFPVSVDRSKSNSPEEGSSGRKAEPPWWLIEKHRREQLIASGLSTFVINDDLYYALNLGANNYGLGYDVINADSVTLQEVESDSLEIIGTSLFFSLKSEVAMKTTMQFIAGHYGYDGRALKTAWHLAQQGLKVDEAISFFDQSTGNVDVSADVQKLLDEFGKPINSLFKLALPSAPDVKLIVNTYNRWINDGLIRWICLIDRKEVPLTRLSWTQQRWLKNAFLSSLYLYPRRVYFFDEPERGLQRQIETNVEKVLTDVSDHPTTLVLLTTHSPFFMRSATVVALTSADEREIAVVDGNLYAHAEELGLSISEIFEINSLILFVEGVHDKAILEGLIGREELKKTRIQIIATDGLLSWSGFFETEIAQKNISCKIAWLIDGIDNDSLQKSWVKWQQFYERNNRGENINIRLSIEQNFERWFGSDFRSPGSKKNNRIYQSLVTTMNRAVTSGHNSRIRFFSSSTKDVIMWLDPLKDFGMNRDWDSLWIEAQKRSKNQKNLPLGKAFKEIVKKDSTVKNCLDPEVLYDMASKIRDIEKRIPKEIESLLREIVDFAVG